MSDKEKKNTKSAAGISAKEESYRLAKLLRSGNRELERQLNSKKIRRER
ncbi:MAG: hypothetical protein IJZ47_10520 [Oscillospiraceae bacterium]|nr:hypothetical protein [Oscillospiraceae bacterium]